MDRFNKEFGERLKKVREEKKRENPSWTQGYVADLVGVARSTYTAYERGTKQPPMETVIRISQILGVRVSTLLGEAEEEKTMTAGDMVKEAASLGIDIGFYNEDDLKKLSQEDIEDLRKHFEWIVEKSKQRDNWED